MKINMVNYFPYGRYEKVPPQNLPRQFSDFSQIVKYVGFERHRRKNAGN